MTTIEQPKGLLPTDKELLALTAKKEAKGKIWTEGHPKFLPSDLIPLGVDSYRETLEEVSETLKKAAKSGHRRLNFNCQEMILRELEQACLLANISFSSIPKYMDASAELDYEKVELTW